MLNQACPWDNLLPGMSSYSGPWWPAHLWCSNSACTSSARVVYRHWGNDCPQDRSSRNPKGFAVGLTGRGISPLPCLFTPDGSPQKPPTARASRSSFAPDGAQTPLLMERRSAPLGGGQCVAICDWPTGATDNVRSLRRRGSVFEQEQEKTEGLGLAMVRYATGQRVRWAERPELEKPSGFEP